MKIPLLSQSLHSGFNVTTITMLLSHCKTPSLMFLKTLVFPSQSQGYMISCVAPWPFLGWTLAKTANPFGLYSVCRAYLILDSFYKMTTTSSSIQRNSPLGFWLELLDPLWESPEDASCDPSQTDLKSSSRLTSLRNKGIEAGLIFPTVGCDTLS